MSRLDWAGCTLTSWSHPEPVPRLKSAAVAQMWSEDRKSTHPLDSLQTRQVVVREPVQGPMTGGRPQPPPSSLVLTHLAHLSFPGWWAEGVAWPVCLGKAAREGKQDRALSQVWGGCRGFNPSTCPLPTVGPESAPLGSSAPSPSLHIPHLPVTGLGFLWSCVLEKAGLWTGPASIPCCPESPACATH